MDANIESGWVNICPYLEVTPPHPLAAAFDPTVKSVREIYDFCAEENPSSPQTAFMKHFNRLPTIPGAGGSKLSQVLQAIRMIKLARQSDLTSAATKKALAKMGIKK